MLTELPYQIQGKVQDVHIRQWFLQGHQKVLMGRQLDNLLTRTCAASSYETGLTSPAVGSAENLCFEQQQQGDVQEVLLCPDIRFTRAPV